MKKSPRENEKKNISLGLKHGVSLSSIIEDRQLLDRAGIHSALVKMADEILEFHPKYQKLLLIGIHTGGVYLAERLQRLIKAKTGYEIQMGVMDITLYRDDPFVGLPRPEVGLTQLPCSIQGRKLILVDDVLFTGRTIRSALMELMDFGRPQCVELAVLIDRGHRELPIRPDYVGLKTKTLRKQSVRVFLTEKGEADRVAVFKQAGQESSGQGIRDVKEKIL